MPIKFSNSYLELGTPFSQKSLPTPVVEPQLLLWNTPLAQSLTLPFSEESDRDLLAQYFSGNELFESSQPIAQAYSGHQFGYFNPQLGDGRAHLLGDVTDDNGKAWDIQLKGSGTSHFSRQGDGRCALGPALREFIMSEAMQAVGVPTTRCLAVVATGQAVYRERALPGAIVTRVASSHIRVGTFQFFAARKDTESLTKLTEFAIKRHFPEITLTPSDETLTSQNILDFFAAVLAKQVELVVDWQRVGFIHGVMNTDNTAISGETIDYGPCAMMNHYHKDTVFSSIDKNARYAFGNQSKILQWNMARLADCLLLILGEIEENSKVNNNDESDDDGEEIALAKISPLLQEFANHLQYGYFTMMVNKLGIAELAEGDIELVNDFLAIMQEMQLDYTQSFVTLENNLSQSAVDELLANEVADANSDESNDTAENKWQVWFTRWYSRIGDNANAAKALMQKTNPLVIPRNHHVEAILASTQETGDLTALHDFLNVLQHPYENTPNTQKYQDSPVDGDVNYNTFCGT